MVWYIYSMTYAIVESGNKQYKVEKGSVIDVELLEGEKDKPVDLKSVLLVADGGNITIGTPYVKAASVKCRLIDEVKDKKVVIFKYKSKSNYHKKTGHRQKYSRLLVEDISAK